MFEWDSHKNEQNIKKHHISFEEAQFVFDDVNRLIVVNEKHSTEVEKRFFCIGRIVQGIVTVRFVYRDRNIRIIGAGFWREGRKLYEEQNGL